MRNQRYPIRRAASTRSTRWPARGVLLTDGPVRRAIYYNDPDPVD